MFDDRRVQASKRLTSMVYKRTCSIVGYGNHDLKKALFYDEMSEEEYFEKRIALDKVYVEQILKLSTNTLNEILQIHETGQLRRAPRTVDAIANELLERELNENKGATKEAK